MDNNGGHCHFAPSGACLFVYKHESCVHTYTGGTTVKRHVTGGQLCDSRHDCLYRTLSLSVMAKNIPLSLHLSLSLSLSLSLCLSLSLSLSRSLSLSPSLFLSLSLSLSLFLSVSLSLSLF